MEVQGTYYLCHDFLFQSQIPPWIPVSVSPADRSWRALGIKEQLPVSHLRKWPSLLWDLNRTPGWQVRGYLMVNSFGATCKLHSLELLVASWKRSCFNGHWNVRSHPGILSSVFCCSWNPKVKSSWGEGGREDGKDGGIDDGRKNIAQNGRIFLVRVMDHWL